MGRLGRERTYTAMTHGVAPTSNYRHFGERFVFVLSGSIRISFDEKDQYDLNELDAIHYGAHEEHSWVDRSEEGDEVKVLVVSSPALF